MNILRQIPLQFIDKRILSIRTIRQKVAPVDPGQISHSVQKWDRSILNETDTAREIVQNIQKRIPLPSNMTESNYAIDDPIPKFPLDRRARLQLRRPEKRLLALKFDHIPIEDQVVVMFPGYGTQYLTMGNNVINNPNSKRIFDQANEFLKFDLFDLCQNGPKTKLDQIVYSHLAIFVSSIAAFEKLKTEQSDLTERLTDISGFGIGEFCSLVAANVISYDNALKMMKIYADAAQRCSQLSYSSMVTIRTCAQSQLLNALNEAREYSKLKGEMPLCELAAYLFCHVKIIAGTMKSLEFLKQHSDHFKIQIVKFLPIYCAFHTTLMNEAANDVSEFLDKINEIKIPRVNVYSNYTGKPHAFRIQRIKRDLVQQITNPIKWEQIAQLLFEKRQNDAFPSYIEVGPGKQLGDILYNIGKKTRKTYMNYST